MEDGEDDIPAADKAVSKGTANNLPRQEEAAEKLFTAGGCTTNVLFTTTSAGPSEDVPAQTPYSAEGSAPAAMAYSGLHQGVESEQRLMEEVDTCGFAATRTFRGARPGYAFMLGPMGQGYYLDAASDTLTVPNPEAWVPNAHESNAVEDRDGADSTALELEAVSVAPTTQSRVPPADGIPGRECPVTDTVSMSSDPSSSTGTEGSTFSAASASSKPATSRMESVGNTTKESVKRQPASGEFVAEVSNPGAGSPRGDERPPPGLPPAPMPREPMRHYWGQALQYLDRSVPVVAGKKLTLLAKRDGSRIRFSLRVRPWHTHVIPRDTTCPQCGVMTSSAMNMLLVSCMC